MGIGLKVLKITDIFNVSIKKKFECFHIQVGSFVSHVNCDAENSLPEKTVKQCPLLEKWISTVLPR